MEKIIELWTKCGGTVQKVDIDSSAFAYISVKGLEKFSDEVQSFGQSFPSSDFLSLGEPMADKIDADGILIKPKLAIEAHSTHETKRSFMSRTLEKNRALISENETLKRRIGELIEKITKSNNGGLND